MYKLKIKVSYKNLEDQEINKRNEVLSVPVTEDKQAGAYAKILFAGLKSYYTKKAYTISVTLQKGDDVLADYVHRVTPEEVGF